MPNLDRLRRTFLLPTLLVAAMATAGAAQAQQTPAEASGFSRYTTHAELLSFMEDVQAASMDMRLGMYGQTWQGRPIPYAIFSRPSVREPWEALVSGKPIIVLSANVHGGERTLRESLLIMNRELATRGTTLNRYLDDLVILVAPTINPDGFEATERGTRGNAFGIDMNRDYMKLEQPALRAFVTNLTGVWHPHLVVDGHNGGSYPYNICYQGPSHASSDPTLTALCDEEIFPLIDRMMQDNGYKSFYYTGGNERRWRTGGWDPRIGRNYNGFTNSVGILFESPGGQDMETGVKSGIVAFTAILEYARANSARLMDTVAAARARSVRMGDAPSEKVTVQQRYGPEDWSVTYEVNTAGRGEERRMVTVTSDSLMKEPVPTLQRDLPWAYLLPRDATAAVELLREHGIAVEMLREEVTLTVQAYRAGDITYRREYNHDAAVVIEVAEVVSIEEEFPEGTFVIPTGQIQGRVAAHLLEPETDDNVFRWNRMDAWLPKRGLEAWKAGRAEQAPILPVWKVLSPTALPTRLLP